MREKKRTYLNNSPNPNDILSQFIVQLLKRLLVVKYRVAAYKY